VCSSIWQFCECVQVSGRLYSMLV